ncbi:SDR family oxidoreductase [Sinomicrobium weinanense]|uniref:SDR family oxidoreductase n=1 Tax=Sinomicrobium weinanense TaxID=2842200 RepID=A0A926JUW3_9FLAO|nr:SDR family oxidoreductase [Sinomicrobium weinanense]MBC9797652.1 SDR family oxidoreductase [Sinomicrobium weinanense]MBU3122666.1 SDR family oxidoreductase [Sinomicrobium weinanense]
MSQVVLITGGSSGIGKSIGEFLTARGYRVYGTSRNPERVTGSAFPLLRMDVREEESVEQAVNSVVKEESRVDVLINNAGVGITGPLEEIPDEEVKNNFEINVFGPVRVIRSVLPHMREQGSGLIINVTSIAGYMGLPYRGVYSASKGALELITETLSMEIKKFGIQAVNVAPGDFATNIAAGRYHAPLKESSPYRETYGNTLQTMDEHVDSGSDPEQMARAVYAIIQSGSPRIHYKVGASMQKFSIVLKRILPDKVYERLLMNHYKL